MDYEFPVEIGLICGHGDDGDCTVYVELTEEEVERLSKAAKEADAFDTIDDFKEISDIAEKVHRAFRDDQIGYMDDYFLEEAAEDFEKEPDELTDEEKWEFFNNRYDYSIRFPSDIMDQDEDENEEEEEE